MGNALPRRNQIKRARHWQTMARQMVMELRNHYRLQAFVFNHGAEEKRKEDARVKAIIEKQRGYTRQ